MTPHNAAALFLTGSILLGAIMIVLLGPVRGPDEGAHSARTYEISRGGLRSPLPEHGEYTRGTVLPRSVGETIDRSRMLTRDVRAGARYTPDLIRETLYVDHPVGGEMLLRHGPQQATTPLLYAPGAALAALIPDEAPVLMLYAMRLGSCLGAILVIYGAIRLAGPWAWIFVVTAFIPVATYLRGTNSADNLTTALVFLFTAAVLSSCRREERLSHQEIALLAGTFLLLALTKTPYVVLGLLLLAIPIRRFGGWLRMGLTTTVIVLPGAIAWATWTLLVARNFPPTPRPEWDLADRAAQLAADPAAAIGLIALSMVGDLPRMMEESLVAGGWSSLGPAPVIGITVAAALLAVASLAPERTSARFRALGATAVLACITLIYVSLHLAYSPPGSPRVAGVQGRYFIPLLPLILLILPLPRVTGDRLRQATAACVALAVIGWSSWQVVAVLTTDYDVTSLIP